MYTEIFNDDMLLRDCMYVCIFFLVPLLKELRVGALSTTDFRGYPFFAAGGAFFSFFDVSFARAAGTGCGAPAEGNRADLPGVSARRVSQHVFSSVPGSRAGSFPLVLFVGRDLRVTRVSLESFCGSSFCWAEGGSALQRSSLSLRFFFLFLRF